MSGFLLSASPCFSQPYADFKYPETYLPYGSTTQIYKSFEGEREFEVERKLVREGSEFLIRDSVRVLKHYRLIEGSLYFVEQDLSDRIIALKSPLLRGKSWRESNSVTVEVLGLGETVTQNGITYRDCLKLLKTYPPGSFDEEWDYEVRTFEYYAPGKWLVLETSYHGDKVYRMLVSRSEVY